MAAAKNKTVFMSEPTNEIPFHSMRRKDREITDPTEMDQIIYEGKLMHLALVDGEWPAIFPVFYGYDGKHLYFHSAMQGHKINLIKQSGKVCFEISIDHGIIEDPLPCDFEARHRTVIGHGQATFVTNTEEKTTALDLIVAQFTPKKFEYPPARLNHTNVVKIEIVNIKGKKHGC